MTIHFSNKILRMISMKLLTQLCVSIVHWHPASQVGWYDITPPPCKKKNIKTTWLHTVYALSTGNWKIKTPCESTTSKILMATLVGKITNYPALSIFLLTMSRLSQEQFNIALTMLVNGALVNSVAQYFNMFIALPFQDCRHDFIILWLSAIAKAVANHVTQLVRSTAIFNHWTQRNRFLNAALASRNIPEQTAWDQPSANRPAVRHVLRPHHRQARLQV